MYNIYVSNICNAISVQNIVQQHTVLLLYTLPKPKARIKEQTGGFLLPAVFLRLTFAAALHLADLVEGVGQQVGQPAVQVNGSQAAFVSFPRCDQPGQAAVHALPHTAHVQLTCRDSEPATVSQ